MPFIAAVIAAQTVIASIELSGPFHTRAPWTFRATQGPEMTEPILGDEKVPGAVTLCLSRDGGRTCDAGVTGAFARVNIDEDDSFAQAHYLQAASIESVPAKPARAALLVRTATLQSADGDQGVRTQIMVYDRARDVFSVAYDHVVGHNNNQEVRFMTAGPLRGDVVSAEPEQAAPYGYWITVSKLSGNAYRQVLRYRSATRYGDGNPLAVIDSEMPNIQRRLGVWRPGKPLPLPEGLCVTPHLVKGALWCQ